MSAGCVYLVGAGPGDPRLLTIRGRELLGRADAVVYDHLVSGGLVDLAPGDAEGIYVGKKASKHTLEQDRINELLIRLAREGKQVVRLKGGDPFVFGRGGEEAMALAEAAVPFEIVPGVTAGVAAAAYAGIPVTHRRLAGAVGLISGHEAPDKHCSDLDFEVLAKWKGTLVFYMGVKNMEAICGGLTAGGLDPQTPAAVVRWGSTPRQQVITGTVGDLAARARAAKIAAPALIVIGRVVTLRDKLNWFEPRPLFGRRIIVTRPRKQASRLVSRLAELGADVVELPTIRIEPPEDPAALRQAAAEAGSFDWIVFTSVNAVEALFDALERIGRDARGLAGCRVCSIGPATAERLRRFGIGADAQPASHTSADIPDAIAAGQDLSGAKILYPRSDLAGGKLANQLAGRGATVVDVVAYRTVPDESGAGELAAMLAARRVHWITFTSSSTVRNFLSLVSAEQINLSGARLASIGPATSQALRQAGLSAAVEADPHTIPGLVDAILTEEASSGDSR